MPSGRRRVIYAGGAGEFSRLPLERLLAAGVEVAAVLLARRADELPVAVSGAPGVAELALAHDVPLLGAARHPSPAQLADLRAARAEIMLVACYPWRLHAALYELCPLGAVNLHPSLLPAYRGPQPIYWQLRHRVAESGVSLHRVVAELDAGPIVARRAYGMTGDEDAATLTRRLAHLGAELLLNFLGDPETALSEARAQDLARASYHGFAGK